MVTRNTIFSIGILCMGLIFGCGSQKDTSGDQKVRIISLSPHITEILFILEADEQVVAVTDFCRFPVEARSRDKIGGLVNPNIEKMVALKPTHIFGIPAHADLATKLRRFDLYIRMFPNETIAEVLESVQIIGTQIGKPAEAEQFINKFNESLNLLNPGSGDHPLEAMLVIGREPGSMRNIMVAGQNTFISELWEVSGGHNLYHDLPSRYSNISIESILKRNPDVIIELAAQDSSDLSRIASPNAWSTLETISAVQNGHIFRVSGSYTMIPGPRMINLAHDFTQIIKQVRSEKRLYSDLYRQRQR